VTSILLDSVATMRQTLPKHVPCAYIDLHQDDDCRVLDAVVAIDTPGGHVYAHLGDTVTIHPDHTVTISRRKIS
jgi:hypothetical protein